VNVPVAVPAGVVTVTVLAEAVALAVIVKDVVRKFPEGSTVTAPIVTPPPAIVTVVPVAVKLLPLMVTGETVVPRTPVAGAIEVTVGAGGLTTVKTTAFVVPPGAITVTLLGDSAADPAMAKFALIVVSFTTVTPLIVTLPPVMATVPPVRPTPVSVTGTVLPRVPEIGLIAVSDGAVTVNVTPLLVPPPVVTVTSLAETVALAAMVNVAVIVVGFTTVRLLTTTPVAAVTVIAVAPVRFVPVRVTTTGVSPLTPEAGEIEISVGFWITPWNSVAPTSKNFRLLGSGLRFPKKSLARVGIVATGWVVALSGT
jgi:hypothetical protein